MSRTRFALETAQNAFRVASQPATAAVFLRALMTAEAHDAIDDDEFLDGLTEIEIYLRRGGTIVSDAAANTLRNL